MGYYPPTSAPSVVPREAPKAAIQTKVEEDLSNPGWAVLQMIARVRAQRVRPATEAFLPGRTCFVFNVDPFSQGQSLPTTLIRSKAEALDFETGEGPLYPPSQSVSRLVSRSMKDMLHSRELREQRVSRAITEILPAVEQEESDSDDDIFEDADDSTDLEAFRKASGQPIPANRVSYFPTSLATPVEQEITLPLDMLSSKQQQAMQELSTVNYNHIPEDKAELSILEKEKAREKESDWNEEYFGKRYVFREAQGPQANREEESERKGVTASSLTTLSCLTKSLWM